jgi:hypothetical protein
MPPLQGTALSSMWSSWKAAFDRAYSTAAAEAAAYANFVTNLETVVSVNLNSSRADWASGNQVLPSCMPHPRQHPHNYLGCLQFLDLSPQQLSDSVLMQARVARHTSFAPQLLQATPREGAGGGTFPRC